MTHSEAEPGAPILGLDLGTSTCLACVIHEGQPLFVRSDLAYHGVKLDRPENPSEVMPSAFWYQDGSPLAPLVGHRALEKLVDVQTGRNVAVAVKRQMHLDEKGKRVTLGGRKFRPSQITGEYVKVLVRAAEIELDLKPRTIKKAVVTVPSGWGDLALKATIRACTEFGPLSEVELVDEPVAAAYGLGLHDHPGRLRVLIVDLGGGTLDVTLWDVGSGAGALGFSDLGRDGDTQLGGLSWDQNIAISALRKLQPALPRQVQEQLIGDPFNYSEYPYNYGHVELYRAAEEAKKTASMQMKRNGLADPRRLIDHRQIASLYVSFPLSSEKEGDHRSAEVPSEEFLRINEMLLRQCDLVCERLFHDAALQLRRPGFGWADLDRVYLAGGGSLLPAVQRRFAEHFGKPPLLADNPQHAVALGAALLARLWRQGTVLPGVIGRTRYPKSLGVLVWPRGRDGTSKFYPVIPRNQVLPFDMSQKFPIHGGPSITRLEIHFAEQEIHHDRSSDDELITLSLENLPAGPVSDQPEWAHVSVKCGVNQSPMFRIEFRGRTIEGDLNKQVKAPPPLPPRGATEPVLPAPSTNGTAGAHGAPTR